MRIEHAQAGPISHDEAEQILGRFNASHWHHTNPSPHEVARYSIPANPLRDDDIRLGAYIAQQRAKDVGPAADTERVAEIRAVYQRLVEDCEGKTDLIDPNDLVVGELLAALDEARQRSTAAIEAERAIERERCASVADDFAGQWKVDGLDARVPAAKTIAHAIREGGTT